MDADRLVTASQLLSKKGEFDGEPNEPFCCQPRVGYKSWAHVLRHMNMFKENVAGYTWHRSSLGQTVEKAMKMFKKDSTRAHLLLPSSSPVLHGRCSTVVAVWKCVIRHKRTRCDVAVYQTVDQKCTEQNTRQRFLASEVAKPAAEGCMECTQLSFEETERNCLTLLRGVSATRRRRPRRGACPDGSASTGALFQERSEADGVARVDSACWAPTYIFGDAHAEVQIAHDGANPHEENTTDSENKCFQT